MRTLAADLGVRHARAERRGFAIVATVFALVIVAALVTGAFFAAEQELRVARNGRDAQRALSAAEAALSLTVAGWDGARLNGLAVGDSAVVAVAPPQGTGAAGATVVRLNEQLFLVRATGQSPGEVARRTLGLVVRLVPPPASFRAAVTVLVAPAPEVSDFIDGVDRDPSGWSCEALPGDTLPGVVVDSGSMDWDALVALAQTIYEPAELPGPIVDVAPMGDAATCDETARSNWGEPGRPATVAGCATYFPTVYANGDLTLAGGRGQGLLLVEGDLVLGGGFEFDGAIIVRGSFSFVGSGASVRGGVVASSLRAGPDVAPGGVSIGYSSCALRRALGPGSRVQPLERRAWGELF